MSLIDVAEELEYVPEQELINLSRNPQSRFPQFLVLSEVQRRNQMRRMYENQVNKAEQPLTTVADEKVMELAQSSAMPNVPSPMSNETSQSPRGLLGMASEPAPMPEAMMMAGGGLTEYMEEVGSELKRIKEKESRYADRNKKQEEGKTIFSSSLSPKNYVIPDKEYKRLVDKGKIGGLREYTPFMLLLNALSGEGAFSGSDRVIPESKIKGLEAALKQSRNEMQQRQLGLESGGLVSLQQGRTTDYQENIERSLERPLTTKERELVEEYEKELQKRKDYRLFGNIRDAIAENQLDIEFRREEAERKMKANRAISKLPRPLRNYNIEPEPVVGGLEEALNEQALLRESLAPIGNLGETGTSQASISEGEPAKTKAEGTNILQQIFDTSGQLGLPKVEIPRMTEEEKQRELGIYALGIMADAFGTGKNIGEAGSKLGKGVQGLLDIKRTQRQDDIKADSAIRAQSVEDITLANTLLKTQLLQDQYKKQGETNKVKALEILREEIERLKENTLGLPDETTKERIAKLQAQLDAELNRMFGTEALATYPGM